MTQDPIANPTDAPATPLASPVVEPAGTRGDAADPSPDEPPEAVPVDTSPAVELESDEALGLSAGDRFFAATTGFVILALIIAHWARLTGWGARVVEIDRQSPRSFVSRLDINTATWVEIAELDGIGPVLARRIVADREENGRFTSVDALRRVSGIGPKTLEKLRPLTTVRPVAKEASAVSGGMRAEAASK